MKRIGMQASSSLDLTGMGGLNLVGGVLKRFTAVQAQFNAAFIKGPGGIPYGDVIIPGVAMICTGKSDYEAVSQLRHSAWAPRALQVSRIASPETLRQNLDLLGQDALSRSQSILNIGILDVVRNAGLTPSALWTGHVALDIDTTPQDNGKTMKEGVGRTYKGCDGYCPILAYAGLEGFLIGGEFRIGTQHSQKGAPAFIADQIRRLRSLDAPRILVRLDSGFDAAETMLTIRKEEADFIISFNPRGENLEPFRQVAEVLPRSAWIRPEGTRNLRIAYLEIREVRKDKEGNEIVVRRIIRVKKRLERYVQDEKKGRGKKGTRQPQAPTPEGFENPEQKALLKPRAVFEVGSIWSTQLDLPAPEVARLYEDHGTSEQFHSEMKSELDLERLPSGKFNTNALVFQMGCLAYNVLRVLGILGKAVFKSRHPAKRKRLKTVIQELILIPARILRGSNQMRFDLGCPNPGKEAILALHRALCGPITKAA
jgi:hypothetical protein